MRATLFAVLLLVVGAFPVGCGGGGSSMSGELSIGYISWDENVAIANLTKVLLEDELDYEKVELQGANHVHALFQGVGNGDPDVFQDVWMPNHEDYLSEVQEDVEQLGEWYRGETSFGLAVPSYMEATSLENVNQSGATLILGIEPGAVIMEAIPDRVIPAYGLEQDLVEASTPGMLAEVEARYNNREEFLFIAWSPHWMNQKYDFRYLEDPKDSLGELNDPARISSIVRKDLSKDDPVAYAFLSAITLDEEQVNDLESTINEMGDPIGGARTWVQNNRDVVQPWIDAARAAQES